MRPCQVRNTVCPALSACKVFAVIADLFHKNELVVCEHQHSFKFQEYMPWNLNCVMLLENGRKQQWK
jgi:hypothetical protein